MLKTPGNFTDNDFKKPMSQEIWDARNKNKWLSERKYFVDQFTLEDLEPKNKSTRVSRGLSQLERHDEQRIKLLRMITLHTSTKLHFGYIFQNWNILYTAQILKPPLRIYFFSFLNFHLMLSILPYYYYCSNLFSSFLIHTYILGNVSLGKYCVDNQIHCIGNLLKGENISEYICAQQLVSIPVFPMGFGHHVQNEWIILLAENNSPF